MRKHAVAGAKDGKLNENHNFSRFRITIAFEKITRKYHLNISPYYSNGSFSCTIFLFYRRGTRDPERLHKSGGQLYLQALCLNDSTTVWGEATNTAQHSTVQ